MCLDMTRTRPINLNQILYIVFYVFSFHGGRLVEIQGKTTKEIKKKYLLYLEKKYPSLGNELFTKLTPKVYILSHFDP